ILGGLVGLIFGEQILFLQFFGDLFIRLLKMIMMPIIFTTITVGAASINPKNLGNIGGKIVLYYIFTSIIAVAIGLALGNYFQPGVNLNIELPSNYNPDISTPSLSQIFLSIVPTNPFASFANTEPLPIIFFSIILGLGIAHLKDSKKEALRSGANTVFNALQAITEVIFMITRGILEYAPIGTFAIIAIVIADKGTSVIGPFMKLIVLAYSGMLLHIILVYGGLLLLFGINPWRFFKNIKEALITAYVSRTSSGTLPVSMICAEENLKIPNSICAFTLPLGATINMDGTALYIGLEIIFAANMFGIDLAISQQITIIVTIVLISIGTAGIPSASLILLGGVLKAVNLPLSVIPIFAGFDPICDMMRTLTNVAGDLTGTAIVAKTEEKNLIKKGKSNEFIECS
ncbi:dicarboxylate/amino acid:cation symporter, partial [bacterium]|nr:dicarboxylate/amino acid:cation symporter [bacterium]